MADYGTYSDGQLFLLFTAGDSRAYAQIYERYWELLFRHALRILKEEENARDVVQDVFTALWDKRPTLDGNGPLSSLLYKTLRNRIFDVLDRDKVRNDYLAVIAAAGSEGSWTTDEQLREKELAACIEREIDGLPARMREVFILSRRQQLSYKEIAQRLDISENTVKVQVSRALSVLRKLFTVFLSLLIFLFIRLFH